MTKSELLNLYDSLPSNKAIVILTNEDSSNYYVMFNKDYIMCRNGFLYLHNYDEDLNNILVESHKFSIKAIYKVNTNQWFDVIKKCKFEGGFIEKIWERNEVELTLSEIAEKFNIPVEQLKIKK